MSITLNACSSSAPQKKTLENASPSPTPTPTPPKKPEEFYQCKISNGAGRVFIGKDPGRFIAESKARHECEIYSRHCVLLDCTVEVEEK